MTPRAGERAAIVPGVEPDTPGSTSPRRFWRTLLAFTGPGYMVAVGYMDPGNWATDLGGGSAFGYSLLSVVLASSLVAILLQALSARLGVASERDLAQLCGDRFGVRARVASWALAEMAIIACDLAEVIGAAIALQLLFHIPLIIGVALTTLDTLVLLGLRRIGLRQLEALIMALMALIAACFVLELAMARPNLLGVLSGFVPRPSTLSGPGALYVAIGIMGATIMPHNLYLHSSIVQSRPYARTKAGKREAALFATLDSSLALGFALFVNAAILILAAATFHRTGHTDVAEIQDAHRLLTPLLGGSLAATVFAVALLASGQNSTLTATLAGQIIMEGYLKLRLSPLVRRLATRMVAVVPALAITAWFGEQATGRLLIFSQVLLSLQLPFAIWPLVRFTSDRGLMGPLVNPPWLTATAWAAGAGIVVLNIRLLLGFAGV